MTETMEQQKMNMYRFYDIVVEGDNGDTSVPNEYILNMPDHSMETNMDRQEFVGLMMDILVSVSGLNVCSFRSDPVRLNTVGDY